MTARTAILILVLAVFSSNIYERLRIIPSFYKNAPHRLVRVNNLDHYEIKFENQIKSCEDVLLVEDRHLAIMACDPSRERRNTVMGVFSSDDGTNAGLWAYDYTNTESSLTPIKLTNFPSINDFHSLGMAFHQESSTIFVVNHAKAGPRIELFKLDLDSLTATHTRTIQHQLLHAPNSITVINEKEIYVTNDHAITPHQSKILNLLETYLSIASGTVVHLNLEYPHVQAQIVAYVPFANGIQILDKTTVAVASSSRGAIYLFKKTEHQALKYSTKVFLPFFPDNLSLSENKLLIAGHAHSPSLSKYTYTRHICNDPDELSRADASTKEYCVSGKATSWVSEWSEKEGLKHLYVDTDYPTSATAVKDSKRGVGIISGLYAKGILVWRNKV